jgi:hypothetical protein
MDNNTYKIFVMYTSEDRVNEILNTFKDINNRIISETKGKMFTRFIVELSDEELMIMKLSINPDDSLITIVESTDTSVALFDAHVEIESWQACLDT